MKLIYNPSPNLYGKQSTHSIMRDLLIGLFVVFGFSLFKYYMMERTDLIIRACLLLLSSCVTALVVEGLWGKLYLKQNPIKYVSNSFPLITSVILTLIVPIDITYYALIIGTVGAIVFGKLLFGGFGQNIFNPAAVGRAIIFVSFAANNVKDLVTGATPNTTMAGYNWIITDPLALESFFAQFNLTDLFVGFYNGAIGETSALIILLVGIVLALRKVFDWRTPVAYILTVFVLASVVGLNHGMGLWYSLFHLLTGGLMFGAVFMTTDPVTNPPTQGGKIIFGIGCGILTFLIRIKGNLPEGVLFSILIMNMLSPMIEKLTNGRQFKIAKKMAVACISLIVLSSGLVFAISSKLEAKIPAGAINKGLTINSSDLDRYEGKVIEYSEADGNKTFIVEVNGYAVLDSIYPDTKPNQYKIVLDSNDTVTTFEVVRFSDSDFQQVKIEDRAFLDQFIGFTPFDQDKEVDVVSEATVSSSSTIKALKIVYDYKGEQ
ncbi:MAG: RnfABCDGE type electron transport complex subunit D [Erysipelotrichaceae bacterium]